MDRHLHLWRKTIHLFSVEQHPWPRDTNCSITGCYPINVDAAFSYLRPVTPPPNIKHTVLLCILYYKLECLNWVFTTFWSQCIDKLPKCRSFWNIWQDVEIWGVSFEVLQEFFFLKFGNPRISCVFLLLRGNISLYVFNCF